MNAALDLQERKWKTIMMYGKTIVCTECDWERETTEKYPTLAACHKCGSTVTYKDFAQ